MNPIDLDALDPAELQDIDTLIADTVALMTA
jgi:hypothetical protein